MYSSSRGTNSGQQQQRQPYPSPYSQNLGHPLPVGGPEGSSQLSLASRHAAMLGGPKESELPGYRGHVSAGGPYGGQFSSVYGSAGGQQVPGTIGKGATPSLESRLGFGSTIPDSPRFASGDYISSSSQGYGQKSDPLFSDKNFDYPSMDRRQYGECANAYAGRDLQNVATSLYGDSLGRQHQADIYDRRDQASLLRQEILKSQSLQSASLDGVSRQAEYLATRGASAHHAAQDLIAYGGRADADPRSSSYGAQHTPSILGAAPPQRNAEDLVYSSNPGYGISLPPGRDYASRIGYARELDIREEERRRELLREREKERERERARERDRERDREWERARDRERDRERERERERERVREKLRIKERERERREKDKNREHARGSEARRERSLSRISKDRAERGGSLLAKDVKTTRKESPRREASHRRPSPVREKRREYVCKVYSSTLVESERDFLSLEKRYPRLFVPPQCAKVVVRWPRENLRLSIHTPVSFEHNFVGEDAGAERKENAAMLIKSESPTIVWNAKMILMSGLSQNALEELSSDRSYDDRIPHYCNMLRFAILKRDKAFMAIGGPWDAVDGGDPSVNDSSLVQTVIRYAKDVTQLDLKNCRNWNRFLEIHYDRIGKDGMFSQKEVTVLFVPDLSDCLPSLEAWRDQWFAHKKAISERESQLSLKKDKSTEKKREIKDKETESHKREKEDVKAKKQSESAPAAQTAAVSYITQKIKDEQKTKTAAVGEMERSDKVAVEDDQKNEAGRSASGGKKKILKKVVKPKVGTEKKPALEDPATVTDKSEMSTPLQDEPSTASADGVKTFARKKVVNKATAAKTESPTTLQKELESEAEASKTDIGGSSASAKEATVKKVIKKKVIKRVLKKKTAGTDEPTNGDKGGVKAVVAGVSEAKATLSNLEENKASSKSGTPEKSSGNSAITQSKVDKEEKADEKKGGEKPKEKEKSRNEAKDQKVNHESKNEAKDQKEKVESKSIAKKEVKEKKPEEPPRHPGLFLQTKGGKDSKLHSLSLSLDSLLDYTDKDMDESTFEVSLFAESLQEMLHYQMGCRLLTFLQKLRLKFVMERNQRKRQREENIKEDEKKSTKRSKTDEAKVEDMTIKTETDEVACADDEKDIAKEEPGKSVDGTENVKQEDETTDVDDPEEDPEEDEEMDEASSQHDSVNDEKDAGEKIEADIKVKKEVENSDDKKQDTTEKNTASKPASSSASKENKDKPEKKKKELAIFDRQLLEAFRFFDRNRVGYIRVEDMRLIVHTLGKFLSHRDVKELVQSALLESSTGRDDRILYPALVRMTDI